MQSRNVPARLIGWGSVLLGSLALLLPSRLGPLLGIDSQKGPGLGLTRLLAFRDLLIGLYLLKANNKQALQRGITLRMLSETADFFMTMFGKGIINQPSARKIGFTIPFIILIEIFVRNRLSE